MKTALSLAGFVLLGFAFLIMAFNHPSRISPALSVLLKERNPADSVLVWVFLKDKPMDAYEKWDAGLSAACIWRRMQRASDASLMDVYDAPVRDDYIRQLSDNGLRPKQISRWLNAVSGWITKDGLRQIERLPFVENIDRVRKFSGARFSAVSQENIAEKRPFSRTATYDSAFYGYSYTPLRMLRVDQLHQAGFFGQGIRVAVFDAGFNNLTHEVFDSLRIIATRDFVNGDSSVADDPGQAGSGSHGTAVLSVLAGYKPGKIVGPAFRSEYLLAKTENTESEHPVEEDNWIAALEWAEGYGADVVSSSVAYIEFDSSGNNRYDSSAYNWTWMTGHSTRITKAANIAVQKGMVVVNSAGNEGYHATHNTLGAPADGDLVIAVGSVNASGVRVSSSSVGPTTMGRIKPDVMAMGAGVWTAASWSPTAYFAQNGTSFSCPLISGISAALLSAHPDWTPAHLYQALIKTADRAQAPDREYGYGIVNAFEALNYYTTHEPDDDRLFQNYPNPFNARTTIRYYLVNDTRVNLSIYNMMGQKIVQLVNSTQSRGYQQVLWNGRDANDRLVASGLYICRLKTRDYSKSKKIIFVK